MLREAFLSLSTVSLPPPRSSSLCLPLSAPFSSTFTLFLSSSIFFSSLFSCYSARDRPFSTTSFSSSSSCFTSSFLRLFLSSFRSPTVFSPVPLSVSTLYGAAVSAAQVHVAVHSRGECIARIGASFVAPMNKADSERENKYEMNYRWMLINGYFGELCYADGMRERRTARTPTREP